MKDNSLFKAIGGLLIIVAVLVISVLSLIEPDYNFEETTYVVQTGDCLWSIAENYCPASMDTRDYVSLIMERNGLHNSVIHPGQQLVVYTGND